MKDKNKTKVHLMKELEDLRRQIIELKESGTRHTQIEEALKAGEEKYRSLFEGSGDAIYVTSREGKFIDVNQATFELFGYTRDEMIGMNIIETYVNPADRVRFQLIIEQKGYVRDYEVKFRKKNGTVMDCLLTANIRQGDDGSILGYQGIIRDITERKKMEKALSWEVEATAAIADLSRALLSPASVEDISSLILDNAKHLTDSEFGFVGYIDPQTGYLISPTMTRNIWDKCQVKDKNIVFKKFRGLFGSVINNKKSVLTNIPASDARSSGTPKGHVPIQRFLSAPALIGKTLVGQVSIANSTHNYTDKDLALIERLAALYAIAVQRERAEETIRQMAYHDSLTGLPNRLLFNDRFTLSLAQAKRNKQKLAIMILDLDKFKEVNDTLGHHTGDHLLKDVGKRLAVLLRKTDTVARLGGDEFIILLSTIKRYNDATEIAHKIMQAFQEPFVIDDHEIHNTTSIGIAIYPRDGGDIATLIKNADIAMYRAKEQGRNRYCCYTPLL